MTVVEAQREVRTVFLHGSAGQLVSGVIWLASAAAGTWGSARAGIVILVLGGAMIFPATTGVLRLLGRRASLDRGNPLNALAMQVAFTVPLLLPLAGAATLHRAEWFYPAVMLIVGAHYLPFVFLYGMAAFYPLAGALMAGALLLGLGVGPLAGAAWAAGGWATGVALCGFGAWAAWEARRTAREGASVRA